MRWIVSRYNHKVAYLSDYTDDVVMYDRSPEPLLGTIIVPNIGSDLYDKFTYIIDNYDNLPEVAVYTKANLFDFIKPREFEKIKDNKTFTPILSQEHKEVMCGWDKTKKFSYYENNIYWELNNLWYLNTTPVKYDYIQLRKLLGIHEMEYVPFAPGSNYILPKENILKHSKEFYQTLRGVLDWDRYPGEAFVMERGLYTLWK